MKQVQIRLAEIIEALSKALDMTEGQPDGHCIRCCYIGTSIGREIGLSEPEAARPLLHTSVEGSRLQQQRFAYLRALSGG